MKKLYKALLLCIIVISISSIVQSARRYSNLVCRGNIFDSFFLDDKHVIVVTKNNIIDLYNFRTKRLIKRFEEFDGNIYNTAVSRNKKYLFVSTGKTVRIWSIKSGRIVSVVLNEHHGINHTLFCPFVDKFITGNTGSIELRKIHNSKKIRSFIYPGMINDIKISPNGKYLAIAGGDDVDGELRVYNLITNKLKLKLRADNKRTSCVDFSFSGGIIATGGYDEKIKLWSMKTGRFKKSFRTISGYKIHMVEFSPNGWYITAVLHDPGTSSFITQIFGVSSGRLLRTYRNAFNFAYSPNSKYFALSYTYGLTKIYKTRRFRYYKCIKGNESISFSKNSRFIALGYRNILKIYRFK